jgi:limonene-1,2-epoxide hydrolase
VKEVAVKLATATGTTEELGPLAQRVMKFTEMMEQVATGSGQTIDWGPFSELVATDDFVRVGAYMEVLNWKQFTDFIQEWAGATRFETTIFRVTEIGNVVFQEIEERHYKGDDFIRKNIIAVWEFDDSQRIRHLDIYEQAKDSGQWIIEAAQRTQEGRRPITHEAGQAP